MTISDSTSPQNPLLADWTGAFGLPPFATLTPEHFRPAFDRALAAHRAELDTISANPAAPTFDNTIVALEKSGHDLDRVANVFFVMAGADTGEAIEAIERDMSPLLARHSNAMYLDRKLYARIGDLYARRDSLGLSPEQAQRLAAAGVDKVNHNLNTSERFYGEVCSTHTYGDRIATLAACRAAGLQLCSGGIMGMGETHDDLIDMAMELRSLGVESIPLNFLNAIDGTPLEGNNRVSPRDCLRGLAMMRMLNPAAEIRIAGGRELHLGTLQPLGLYAANSMFVGDYLTTKGQLPEADYKMIAEMGFVITRGAESAEPAPALA